MRTVFDLAEKRNKIKELEKEIQRSDLWQNNENAIKTTQELAQFQEEVDGFNKLKQGLVELNEEKIKGFEEKLKKEELKVFLSGKHDKGLAILTIYSGAGGQDAQDWATMLLRMYERYCQRKGYYVKVLYQSFGEAGGPEGRIGTKQVSLEIKGNYAFGFLKKETGVHRLVRLSPFSAKSLRHTSFSLVEVLSETSTNDESEYKIKSEEIKIETFRSSGPGGQNVNRRETAVRITHLPTGLKAVCQSDRLQGLNREGAMKILRAKLFQLRESTQEKKMKEIKGDLIAVSWGNQIRSYVLHPYKIIKDLRTGVESSAVEKILDGELDEFIEAEIKI